MVDQVSSRFHHPPCPATGAETSAFAGKSIEVLVTATVALHAQKAMLKKTALAVVLELLPHGGRKMSAIGLDGGDKGRVVLLDELIQHRLFRPVTVIGNGCAWRQ